MKKSWILSSLLVGLAAFAAAQTSVAPATTTPPHHVSRWVVEKEVLDKLNLTATQKEQVKVAAKPLMEESKEAKIKGDAKDPAEKEKLKTDRKVYLEKLKTILSPSQWIQYKALHKELREKSMAAKATPTP
jgi:hypothetical protein